MHILQYLHALPRKKTEGVQRLENMENTEKQHNNDDICRHYYVEEQSWEMGNSKNTHIFFMRLTYMDSLDTLYYYEGVNFFLLRHKRQSFKKRDGIFP